MPFDVGISTHLSFGTYHTKNIPRASVLTIIKATEEDIYIKLIGKLPNLEIETESGGSMDIAPLISSFKGFYMLDISNPSVISEINKEVTTMISKGRYDLLMEVKDEGDNVHIYTSGDEKTIESFVFIASDGYEVQFICIDGKINRTDLEALIASAM